LAINVHMKYGFFSHDHLSCSLVKGNILEYCYYILYVYRTAGLLPPTTTVQIAPGSHVVGHGVFDAGARFNSGAGVNIPVSI